MASAVEFAKKIESLDLESTPSAVCFQVLAELNRINEYLLHFYEVGAVAHHIVDRSDPIPVPANDVVSRVWGIRDVVATNYAIVISSLVKANFSEDAHMLMLDIDDTKLKVVDDKIRALSHRFMLGDWMVLRSTSNRDNYHAVFLNIYPEAKWDGVMRYAAQTELGDTGFNQISLKQGFSMLRVSEVQYQEGKSEPQLIGVYLSGRS